MRDLAHENVTTTYCVPLTLARRLAAYAEQTQRSRSAIMRLALDAFLREREAQQDITE